MESVVNLCNQFQSLRDQVDGLNESIEPQFLQLALNFEDCRKRWLVADEELVSCKEILAKTETERGALEVKLKHARNQVDVEIRRRQKAEAVYEKLERQLQLIRELLIAENNGSSVHLSEEQRSALAFLSAHSQAAQAAKANMNSSRRLSRIDESASSVLSDISYDQTNDSLDWDSSVMKNVRLQKRQKRQSSRKHSEIPPQALKKPRSTGRPSDRINESIVAKTTITVPANGGVVEAVSTIETVPYRTRSRKRSVAPVLADSTTTDQSETISEAPSTPISDFPAQLQTPRARGGKKHHFIPKTVIKSEFCGPCGRRTKFGKLYLRCQDCRVVTHPECRDHCPLPCNPTAIGTPFKSAEATLADFAPATSPMIPALVIYCIKEIERRGLHEVGLYRVSGHERMVKELKEKLIRGKTLPPLNKVEDINVITGVLKDFLRNLPEPLLTFHLNKTFLEAAEIQDDGNCLALLYQTINELPQPNRDTLACLMIHLLKVSQSVDTKMDVNNLARVFGPTLVGHAVADPDPMTILHDTSRQPRVVERLLSISESYWSRFAYPDNMGMDRDRHTDIPSQKVSILGPVTTPEHQIMAKTPSSSSLSQRMTSLFGSRSKATSASLCQGSFFASPQLK